MLCSRPSSTMGIAPPACGSPSIVIEASPGAPETLAIAMVTGEFCNESGAKPGQAASPSLEQHGKPGARLLSASQNRGHHTGAAASVDHCHNPQRSFIRSVSNEITPRLREPQRA